MPTRKSWLVLITCLGAAAVLSGCLGQDYKTQPLAVTGSDQGWLLVVEPDETFEVALFEQAHHPGATWELIESDPTTVELSTSFLDPYPHGNPAEVPEDERAGIPENQDALFIFELTGLTIGDSPLAFELIAGGHAIDRCAYTVAVVEDACDGEEGLAAPRCRREVATRAEVPWEVDEWAPGSIIPAAIGDEVGMKLAVTGLDWDTPWQLDDYDPSILELRGTQEVRRTPGNWDTEDESEPGNFRPIWHFTFVTKTAGETEVTFNLAQGGEVVDTAQFTVQVG